eukprot:jgi/Tetstr1/466806/TSEL_011276.t1
MSQGPVPPGSGAALLASSRSETRAEQEHGAEAPLTDLVAQKKAQKIGEQLGLALDPKKFNYSMSWLLIWKKREGACRSVRDDEGSFADTANAVPFGERCKQLLTDPDPDVILNIDENGLNCRTLPQALCMFSLSRRRRNGLERAKDRITAGLSVNATDTR